MTTCSSNDCEKEAITCIVTTAPSNKQGLVHTIYQFEEDGPKRGPRYCGPCGVRLAANLTALTDADLRVTCEVVEEVRT